MNLTKLTITLTATLGNYLKITSMLLLVISISGCNSVRISKQSITQSLVSQRHNIVTSADFSDTTQASLRIAGVDKERCLTYFSNCINQVSGSIVEANTKASLALFAELYYAKSKQLISTDQCNWQPTRPPIDPYYPSSISPEVQEEQQQKTLSCLLDYQDNLNTAIRYSFAYLFYHQLYNQVDIKQITYIPNEQDIQTLDIYQVASNEMISNLYKSSQQDNKDPIKNGNKTFHKDYDTPANVKNDMAINPNQDLVKSAIQSAITFTSPDEIQKQLNEKEKNNGQINAMQVSLTHSHIDIYIPSQLYLLGENSDEQSTIQLQSNIEKLIPTSEIRLSGLNSISKRQGFGLSYIALLKDRYTNDIENFINETDNTNGSMEKRIHGTGQALLSGYVQPTGANLEQVLKATNFEVHLYNPYSDESVEILGQDYSLGANFSAGYALWLTENDLNTTGFANMLDRREKSTLPKLFMLEPYNPNKRVIIMIHGLASSPATWVGVTNDIFNDPKLRENYQVWQVFYPTNIPMIENRYQIQELIETAFHQVDPTKKDIASQHGIIISHSMGGILSRMMLSNKNLTSKLHQLTATRKPSANKLSNQNKTAETTNTKKLLLSAYSKSEVEERFHLHRLPQVDRAVFINAPFKGTDFTDRWFIKALRSIVQLPVGITKTIYGKLSGTSKLEGLKDNPLGALFLENGASQLSNRSSFIELTHDLQIDSDVTYHTIIASQDNDIVKGIQTYQQDQGILVGKDSSADEPESKPEHQSENGLNETINNNEQLASIDLTRKVDVTERLSHKLTKNMSDGVVPYTSSHLDGAKSETIISGGHSIHANPKTILVLRNILHEQLQAHPILSTK